MKYSADYMLDDPEVVKRLIRENPWATFVSPTTKGLVASHYPILLDEEADEIVIVSHFGKPDDRNHGLGQHEMLVIVQGPHGYISPSWYGTDGYIPTWDHVTAHLYGTPEILSDEGNFAVLTRLVDHFEHAVPNPRSLDEFPETSRKVAKGTAGLRLRVTRFDARLKLSQDKPQHVIDRIEHELAEGDAYRHPELAREVRISRE